MVLEELLYCIEEVKLMKEEIRRRDALLKLFDEVRFLGEAVCYGSDRSRIVYGSLDEESGALSNLREISEEEVIQMITDRITGSNLTMVILELEAFLDVERDCFAYWDGDWFLFGVDEEDTALEEIGRHANTDRPWLFTVEDGAVVEVIKVK